MEISFAARVPILFIFRRFIEFMYSEHFMNFKNVFALVARVNQLTMSFDRTYKCSVGVFAHVYMYE